MTDLATRIEAGEATDSEVLLARGWTTTEKYVKDKSRPYDWLTPDRAKLYKYGTQPKPLQSVDDALKLCAHMHNLTVHTRVFEPAIHRAFMSFREPDTEAYLKALPRYITAAIIREADNG